MVNYWSVVMD